MSRKQIHYGTLQKQWEPNPGQTHEIQVIKRDVLGIQKTNAMFARWGHHDGQTHPGQLCIRRVPQCNIPNGTEYKKNHHIYINET